MTRSFQRFIANICVVVGLALGLVACAIRTAATGEVYKEWWEIDEKPEGASVFEDWDFNLNYVNWPGMIMVNAAHKSGIIKIYPDALHAVFFTDSLATEFMIDSLRVRFSGIPGRGPIEIYNRDIPHIYLKVTEIRRDE
ncbi:hypothetical protein ACFL45_05080 [Candidatus Neomarinimicrobiota bacterium]